MLGVGVRETRYAGLEGAEVHCLQCGSHRTSHWKKKFSQSPELDEQVSHVGNEEKEHSGQREQNKVPADR